MPKRSAAGSGAIPSPFNWRTTDTEEIERRRLRAQQEEFTIWNCDRRHPIFSNFAIKSRSGLTYHVEVRSVQHRQFSCDCVDFRINGLGTCKHVEAVLLLLERRFARLFKAAMKQDSTRYELVPDSAGDTLRLEHSQASIPGPLREWFDDGGRLVAEEFVSAVAQLDSLARDGVPQLRISQEVRPWLDSRARAIERRELRREYELKVQSGEWPPQETKVPLFPYQREGMLHLAFTERTLLADEMGLGKTIQAIAACALLRRLGKAQRVLVVTPASLKTEWEEQIQRFTDLSYQLVFGGREVRLRAYENAPFFTVVNYEQMLLDALDVNSRLQPDVVVLDEAQRIKNWNTKTAQAVKRLKSRYAFVLTGTPIENRIDELHSLMDFLDPAVLGPLFRFNREFYDLDDRGRPQGYRNLDQLHARIRPYMLRRRKAEVETELPERTDRNHFVPLSGEQKNRYEEHAAQVARLMHAAQRRPLTQQEHDKLQRELAMCRMICDTNYILDPDERACPKLTELEKILEECRDNPEVKVIIFSEWERMLELVRELCQKLNLGCAWHTGSVPQRRRRGEILAFKTDPACRVFLSTDSGSTGLNLQNASVVINCDLPWNPARLEQRIARAWRKHQTRPVTVINLVSENTIEHRMLETLAVKQSLADNVLDQSGKVREIKLRGGRQAFVQRLEQLIKPAAEIAERPKAPVLPADRGLAFSQLAREKINGALVRCEERYPQEGPHSVLMVVVDRNAAEWKESLASIHESLFASGNTDPLAPTQLEVIDRATDEAIQRLIAAGLITKATRATRPLFPDPQTTEAPALTEEEKARVATARSQTARKLKMARLLTQGELVEEARTATTQALESLGLALAIEKRLPEPASLEAALLSPWAHCWGETLPLVRQFRTESTAPGGSLLDAIAKL